MTDNKPKIVQKIISNNIPGAVWKNVGLMTYGKPTESNPSPTPPQPSPKSLTQADTKKSK